MENKGLTKSQLIIVGSGVVLVAFCILYTVIVMGGNDQEDIITAQPISSQSKIVDPTAVLSKDAAKTKLEYNTRLEQYRNKKRNEKQQRRPNSSLSHLDDYLPTQKKNNEEEVLNNQEQQLNTENTSSDDNTGKVESNNITRSTPQSSYKKPPAYKKQSNVSSSHSVVENEVKDQSNKVTQTHDEDAEPATANNQVYSLFDKKSPTNNNSSNTSSAPSKLRIPAVIHTDQEIVPGIRVQIRTTTNVEVPNHGTILANTFIYGIAEFNENRISITVNRIPLNTGHWLNKTFIVHDKTDMMAGLYTPGTTGQQTAEEEGQKTIQTINPSLPVVGSIGINVGKKKLKENKRTIFNDDEIVLIEYLK